MFFFLIRGLQLFQTWYLNCLEIISFNYLFIKRIWLLNLKGYLQQELSVQSMTKIKTVIHCSFMSDALLCNLVAFFMYDVSVRRMKDIQPRTYTTLTLDYGVLSNILIYGAWTSRQKDSAKRLLDYTMHVVWCALSKNTILSDC